MTLLALPNITNSYTIKLTNTDAGVGKRGALDVFLALGFLLCFMLKLFWREGMVGWYFF